MRGGAVAELGEFVVGLVNAEASVAIWVERTVGMTGPDYSVQTYCSPSQVAVCAAPTSADLAPADIDYIEAHGTGTALGDASELAALQQVFRGQSCLIGSIKTNLGHLDRAAGVTGLIKAALAVQAGQLPPSRNLVD